MPKGLTKDAEQGQLFPRKEVRGRRGGVTVAWQLPTAQAGTCLLGGAGTKEDGADTLLG